MRFILLDFDKMQKIPRDVEVVKIKRPKGFESKMLIRIRVRIINVESRV